MSNALQVAWTVPRSEDLDLKEFALGVLQKRICSVMVSLFQQPLRSRKIRFNAIRFLLLTMRRSRIALNLIWRDRKGCWNKLTITLQILFCSTPNANSFRSKSSDLGTVHATCRALLITSCQIHFPL